MTPAAVVRRIAFYGLSYGGKSSFIKYGIKNVRSRVGHTTPRHAADGQG